MKPIDTRTDEQRQVDARAHVERCARIVWMLLNDSYAARRFQALMTGESDPSLYRSMAVRSTNV